MTSVDIPYLAGLDLSGRTVVVVGGGSVAQRRLATLIDAGARIEVVSPEVTAAIEGMAQAGEIRWHHRPYAEGDLTDAWYAMALTDDPQTNAEVIEEAERRRIFCVRADDGTRGTAATPAGGEWNGLRIGVVSSRLTQRHEAGPARGHDPLRAASVRDRILHFLSEGTEGTESKDQETPRRTGHVALVGGGPGDPDLITVKGRRLLAQADVVVTDRLGPRSLLDQLGPDVEIVDATKLPRGRSMAQETINSTLIEHARQGKFVVRLKGGDPYVFGRGSEELEACVEAGIPVTVVPGLSSAISVPALANIPLTHRGVAHEAVIVSGHLPPGHPDSMVDYDALARLRGTIVILMGVQNLPSIAEALSKHRRSDTPVAVIQDGSMPAERVTRGTLTTIAAISEQADVRAPAIIVIGDVVGVLDNSN